MKKKICFLLVFLLTLTLSAEPNSWDSWTKAQFAAVPAEEQVDKLVEIFATESFYKFRGTPLLLTKCRNIITENYAITKPYVLEAFQKTKAIPYKAMPCDFYILLGLIRTMYSYSFNDIIDPIYVFESKEEYARIMLPLFEEKLDTYLNEYHMIDLTLTEILMEIDLINGINKAYHIEDLFELLDKYTAEGYTDLTINTEGLSSYIQK